MRRLPCDVEQLIGSTVALEGVLFWTDCSRVYLSDFSSEDFNMSLETILIIVVIVFLLGGGGWYWGRGRA